MISILDRKNRTSLWGFLPIFFQWTFQMNDLIHVKISPMWPLDIRGRIMPARDNAQEIKQDARRHCTRKANQILLGLQWLLGWCLCKTQISRNWPKIVCHQLGSSEPSTSRQTKPNEGILKDTKTRLRKILIRCWKGDTGQSASSEFDLTGTSGLVSS